MICEVHAVSPSVMQRLLMTPQEVEPLIHSGAASGQALSLEKAWHGLHFLLSGSAWDGEEPLGFLAAGGEPIGEDLGYGPARLLRPATVQTLRTVLGDITDDALWSRFDPARMEQQGIYPSIWDEPEDDLREEYVGYFRDLKGFVDRAADEQAGLIVVIL